MDDSGERTPLRSLKLVEHIKDWFRQDIERPARELFQRAECYQPRSSYKSSGVYMDDADERKPLLSMEELAQQKIYHHRKNIEEMEQECLRRAENLEAAAAQFEKIPARRESPCCKRCCTIL